MAAARTRRCGLAESCWIASESPTSPSGSTFCCSGHVLSVLLMASLGEKWNKSLSCLLTVVWTPFTWRKTQLLHVLLDVLLSSQWVFSPQQVSITFPLEDCSLFTCISAGHVTRPHGGTTWVPSQNHWRPKKTKDTDGYGWFDHVTSYFFIRKIKLVGGLEHDFDFQFYIWIIWDVIRNPLANFIIFQLQTTNQHEFQINLHQPGDCRDF